MDVSAVGQLLRERREDRSLTVEQAAHATYLRPRYIQALEAGDFAAIPSRAQARGFLRAYASYLGLDPEPMLEVIDQRVGGLPAAATSATETQAATVVGSVTPARPAPRPPSPEVEAGKAKAAEIFIELGATLKRQRELLGLSLDDVERHTHLRRHYLRALEDGRLDDLPSPVQGRGMLNNYAVFLGLDPEPVLLRFAEGLQTRLAVKQAAASAAATDENRPAEKTARPNEDRPPSPFRRLFSTDLLVGGTLMIFLTVFVLWGSIRIFAMRSSGDASPTARSIADVLLTTATPSPTATIDVTAEAGESGAALLPTATEPVTTTIQSGVPVSGTAGVQVYVTIRQRAWMRAVVDGEIQFDGRVIPGGAYSYSGEDTVELLTGNGAGLQVFFNGQDQGPLGSFGQVVDRIYTAAGVVTPTPTITPTPSPTPRVSPTPQPSSTPAAPPGTPTVPPLP